MRRTPKSGLDVQVDAEWVGLESIEGITTSDLIQQSKRACGGRWFERLREDLVEVLTVLGKDVSDGTADMSLRDLKTGKVTEHKGVVMTHEKRQTLRRNDGEEDETPIPHTLNADEIRADLHELQVILNERFSYLNRPGHSANLDALVRQTTDDLTKKLPVPHAVFAREVDRILRAFGDGHTRLRTRLEVDVQIYSPVLVESVEGDGFVVFLPDRSKFVDDDRPYLVAIDGKPLTEWLEASETRYATAGSPVMRTRDAVRGLRFLGDLRVTLGVQARDQVELTVAKSPSGKSKRKVKLAVATDRRPSYGRWPRTKEHTMLDGNIGYLRIAQMKGDADFLEGLDEAMQDFRDAKGLIIDVRGNGGGTRDALQRVFPYFMRKGESPVIANIAAYRLPPEAKGSNRPADGYLSNRSLFPRDWSGFESNESLAVRAAAKRFRPTWDPTQSKDFSEWHYFTLTREDNELAYPFEGQVVLLIDDGCFSATDIFVAPFRGRPGVTILGTPTMGGSGRSRRFSLSWSQIQFQASSMASFRPDGTLYEANGTRPDILIERIPTDVLRGQSDTQLEAALERLR